MSQYDNNTYTPDMPMKWHKFLIYFSLWAGAVLDLLNAVRLFTGMTYTQSGLSLDYVYRAYPALKTVDVVFAIFFVGLAVFTIYTRFQLAGYKTGAPGKLISLYIVGFVVAIAYSMAIASVLKVSISDVIGSDMLGSIIGSVVMVAANKVYYGKRAHLFVN